VALALALHGEPLEEAADGVGGMRRRLAGQRRPEAGEDPGGIAARTRELRVGLEPELADHLAGEQARGQDLHLAVDRGAVQGVAGRGHGGTVAAAAVGLDDHQRPRVVGRRRRGDDSDAGEPAREQPGQQQPAAVMDEFQQLGERQLAVGLPGRRGGGRSHGPCFAASGRRVSSALEDRGNLNQFNFSVRNGR
jgi:hypothetical protein